MIKFKFAIGFLLMTAYGCNGTQNNVVEVKLDSLQSSTTDSVFDQKNSSSDEVIDTVSDRELVSIRENFKKINSIQKWTSVVTKELDEESTEGGEARYFYAKGKLEKITTWHFGEIFQAKTEYYLLENRLSFVYEKILRYNRPITFDSADMQKHGDSAVFDIKKSEPIEHRSYFKNGKLIYGINSPNPAKPLSKEELLNEEKRLNETFESLLNRVKS